MTPELLLAALLYVVALSWFVSGWPLVRCSILVVIWQVATPLRPAFLDALMLTAFLTLTECIYTDLSGRLTNGRCG